MKSRKINIALAGAANVGKSVVFNHLTGLHQHIGNWAGKTVEKAEGSLYYKGYNIDVLDLPGIRSLSTYSLEELITREYIVSNHPDFIANIVDANKLETNLTLTLQLLELEKPLILVLNMFDRTKKNGISIDFNKLEKLLDIPVVTASAIYGKGIAESLDRGIALIKQKHKPKILKYGKEVEERITILCQALSNLKLIYPKRFIAIKLLEKDQEIEKLLKVSHPAILAHAAVLNDELEKIHGHSSAIVMADERCSLASRIAREIMTISRPLKTSLGEKFDHIAGHKIFGYPVMLIILGIMFLVVFKGGGYFSTLIERSLSIIQIKFYGAFGQTLISKLIFSGIESFIALVALVLPYIGPFYVLFFILEDTGYLARLAYLMDNLMHKVGIHGKACLPLILGFGCNVPACLSCRIMETHRERLITGLLTAFVPCSAVSVIIAGFVGKFLGLKYVFGLYLFVFVLTFIIGKIASIITPGEPTELIMEMPSYKAPNIKTIFLLTWFKLKEFIFIAGPIVIISGILIDGANHLGLLTPVTNLLTPITSGWLGLPPAIGILLILGVLRKELILVMLATILGTENFSAVLTHTQLLVLALVSTLYIPCTATIASFYKEFGLKNALFVTILKISLAILIGGITARLLGFIAPSF
jgi:ferrous iron transport protein B